VAICPGMTVETVFPARSCGGLRAEPLDLPAPPWHLDPAVSRPKKAPSARLDRLHRTVDIPQADRLVNVRQLVLAVRDGITHPATLREFLDVDARHFAYYRQASEILGVVHVRPERTLVVTDVGVRLLAAPEGSAEERMLLRDAIVHARALRPFRSFFEGQELPAETIAARLETLTGLSASTALRRARTLVQWRRYVDGGRSGRLPAELSLPDLAPQLDRMVQHHNALAKQRLVDWLMHIDPAEFERLVGRLLTAMGFHDVDVLGGPGDGGVDVRASQLDRWSHPIRSVVQVKRHARALGRRVIDEMIGVLFRHRADHGIIITTSDFSTAARSAAGAEPRLRLVDGAQFVELLAEHAVVVRHGRHGEIVTVGENE
jgi:restriction endonuclease Mrr